MAETPRRKPLGVTPISCSTYCVVMSKSPSLSLNFFICIGFTPNWTQLEVRVRTSGGVLGCGIHSKANLR